MIEQNSTISSDRVILEVRTTRSSKETPEAMSQFLESLASLRVPMFYFFRRSIPVSLEMTIEDQLVHFYITIPALYQAFVESQIVSQYPKSLLLKSKDYLPGILQPEASVALGQLKLAYNYLYPIRSMSDFKDIDPLSSLLGVMAKSNPGDKACIQFMLLPVGNNWQINGATATEKTKDASGAVSVNPYGKQIGDKIASNGFKSAIRIAVNSHTKERSKQFLSEIVGSFTSFNNPHGNMLLLRKPHLWQNYRLREAMLRRSRFFMPKQILNIRELATMFHFPTEKLAAIPNIAWHKVILSDPPENLPIAENKSVEEKEEINFFARTDFRNKSAVFGIKQTDRRRHMYIIGKTGAGKSTLICNMAINDMRNRRGFCIVDPHGDLCEEVLNFVPSFRVNDVVYLDPSDSHHAFSLNPLEVTNESQKELVVSGIVSIFKKMYGTSWGPRLEYILRNTLLTVINLPNPTLLMVPEMLANANFRARAVEKLTDPVIKSFWVNEFEKMLPRQRTEAIGPIQNKVGQFLSSTVIRNIVKNPHSTIDIEKIMNEGKIILLNLSQGKLGEDNAALLGAMIITKIQLAAMNRVNIPEAQRRDFYLYVDEFQNFATSSFVKILSEARKYRLNLLLANQYIAQVPEDVRSAIFGNAGTLLSFLIGATDAAYLAKEFGERFTQEDLLALGNHQAIIKLAINDITQAPFLCHTLPLPNSRTKNREKVIKSSRERYMKEVKPDVVKENRMEKKDEKLSTSESLTTN